MRTTHTATTTALIIQVTPLIGRCELHISCQLQLPGPKVLGSIGVRFVVGFLSHQKF